MTLDEATSALAADPAALVWAGQRFDALVAIFAADPPPSPYSPAPPPGAMPPSLVITTARRAIEKAANVPSRLVAVTDAVDTLSAIIARREADKVAAAAYEVERRRALAEANRAYQAAQARRERAHRSFFPTFQHMRARIDKAAMAIGEAATVSEMEGMFEALASDLTSHVSTMRDVGSTILPVAA